MDGQLTATTEHYAFGIQSGYLQIVTKGAIFVSDNEDDEEEEWYRYDFTDVFLHSMLNIADAVLQGENRKQV